MNILDLLDKNEPQNYAQRALKTIKCRKKIVLFGAAEYGKIICNYLREHEIFPILYCDNSKNKIGTKWNGLDVADPNKIDKDCFIIITCNAYREIMAQLKELGFDKSSVFFFEVKWITKPLGNKGYIYDHIGEFQNIFDRLADNKSKKAFVNLLNYKLTYNFNYTLEVLDENQYFDKNIVHLGSDTVFIDAGAYIGDTLEPFVRFTDGKYKKIMCLEPMPYNVECLKKVIIENKIHDVDVYKLAASDSKKVLYYDETNSMAARKSKNSLNGGERKKE